MEKDIVGTIAPDVKAEAGIGKLWDYNVSPPKQIPTPAIEVHFVYNANVTVCVIGIATAEKLVAELQRAIFFAPKQGDV